MGMSTTLSASFVICLHDRALQSKFGGELGDRCGVSVLPVAQLSSAIDSYPRAFGSGSDVTDVSPGKWSSRNLVPGDDNSNRSMNGLEIVHGLGRSSGLRTAGRVVRPEHARRKSFWVCAAGDPNGSNSKGDDPVETLFMKELKRRGISADSKGSTGTDTRTKSNDDGLGSSESGWSQGRPTTKPPPKWTASRNDDQLKRSMALNSEGLEGLIPRATELFKLGGSFWIVFWPLILASLATFITLYVCFGSNFLHTGTSIYPGGRSPYIEPYQLLEEETIPSEIGPDRVPFRSNSTP